MKPRPVVHHGDCLDVLRDMPDASVHAVVTDPPYSLTDGGKQDCASDMLRDAIVMDAANGEAEGGEGRVTLRITVSDAWTAMVGGVHLDNEGAGEDQEVHDDGLAVGKRQDVLVDEGDAMPGEKRGGSHLRLWVRQGGARCVGACRCLRQGSAGLIRVPVRLGHDALGQPEGTTGVVAGGGAEVAAVLALDLRRRTGELLPARGADALDPPFEIVGALPVGARPRARRFPAVPETGGVGGVGDPAGGALTFDLLAHKIVLLWRPTILRGFMSREWDGTGIETDVRLWRECMRVLKPGGHVLAFGGTRTWHRLACAIEDAGFDVRDSIAWISSQGFPKSLDVSKAIDKAAGAERTEVLGHRWAENRKPGVKPKGILGELGADDGLITAPATPAAEKWQGWGTALKPSHEPVVVARKPAGQGAILGEIGSHLDRLEAAWLAQGPARRTRTGAAGASNGPTAMSPSESMAATSWNTVSSWRKCWDVLCSELSTSTTGTTSSTTTALTTLSSCLSQITPASITTDPTSPHGLTSLASAADHLFASAVCASHATLALSAIEPATASTPPAPQGEAGRASAFEPVVVARKPLAGTVAGNVQAHGTGALNIDACRTATSDADKAAINGKHAGMDAATYQRPPGVSLNLSTNPMPLKPAEAHAAGRWPANVALDESQAAALDQQSGVTRDGVAVNRNRTTENNRATYSAYRLGQEREGDVGYGGEGGASRFFPTFRGNPYVEPVTHADDCHYEDEPCSDWCAYEGGRERSQMRSAPPLPTFRYEPKAPTDERPRINGVAHATVKPLDLMRWLVRLVTPPGGTVLDPFAGTGTTLEAAMLEGFASIGIERDDDHLPLIRQRLDRHLNPAAYLRNKAPAGEEPDLGLLGLLDGEETA